MEHILRIYTADQLHELTVAHGTNLRRVLLEAGFSPYTKLTRSANCGGRRLRCMDRNRRTQPTQWHDRIGAFFGSPRLSCQITITEDKLIWGAPDSARRFR